MYLLFAFAIALLIAVYLSGLAERSPVSTSVFFLIAGFLVGPGALNLITVHPGDPAIDLFVRFALVAVLFTDGMEIDAADLHSVSRLSGRALIFGLPITMVIMAALAHLMTGIPWVQAFLLGAVLSPTDPVFVSTLSTHPTLPDKVRKLLNVESGINDGLALPFILMFLALMNREDFQLLDALAELGLGIVIGIAITWSAFMLRRLLRVHITPLYQPLLPLSIGLLVFAAATIFHGNIFLAAFAAGVTAATLAPDDCHAYLKLGKPISELLKLAGLIIFGSLLSIAFFSGVTLLHLLFAILVLLFARPIGLNLALIGSTLSWKERLTAGWFGPRGFASVLYTLLVYRAASQDTALLFRLIAMVILISIVLHTSTDSFVSRVFPVENGDERGFEEKAAFEDIGNR